MFKLIFVFAAVIILGCGKDPVPPVPPVPPTPPAGSTFTVTGKKIVVQGTMKPGTKVATGSAEAVVKAAVRMLETQAK